MAGIISVPKGIPRSERVEIVRNIAREHGATHCSLDSNSQPFTFEMFVSDSCENCDEEHTLGVDSVAINGPGIRRDILEEAGLVYLDPFPPRVEVNDEGVCGCDNCI